MTFKREIRKLWWLWGILSAAIPFCIPYIGWYAAGNAATFAAGYYVLHLAAQRKARLVSNEKLLKKMDKRQREKIFALDAQESKNIYVLSRMMLLMLVIINFSLNVYTYIYFSQTGTIMTPFSALKDMPNSVCVGLLGLDGVVSALLYLGVRWRTAEIMTL